MAVSGLVAALSVLGLLVTLTLLPEPKGTSLEQLTETRGRHSATALAVKTPSTRPSAPPAPAGPQPRLMRSLEVRWILPGQLGAAVARWFARFPARVESREDTYLADPALGGLSVKLRQGSALEVKAYQGSPGILEVAGCARGRLESWDKWSFPCPPPGREGADPPGWRPVHKLIHRFTATSGQSKVPIRRRGEQPRCDVELTEIHAGGRTWWTLGFEVTGPASQLRTQLKATAALVFAQALPGGMELGIDHSQSYAQWLTDNSPDQ